MGASHSALGESHDSNAELGLGDIPEDCIARIFLYLTPPEICNLSRLNRAFRGAASSDFVWEKKLPANYRNLLDRLHGETHQAMSKKEIFALLSRPVTLDDGNKRAWIDRITGGLCMAISARGMDIIGIEDRRYWNWIATEESRFQLVAYLQQMWWFEVDGELKFPLPPDTYTLSFKIHLGRLLKRRGRRLCNFEHTHGWGIRPVRFMLSTGDGQESYSEFYLDDKEHDDTNRSRMHSHWVEYKVGEFIVGDSEAETEVRWSMKQIDCTHSKGGLCIDSVYIIPTHVKKRERRKVVE